MSSILSTQNSFWVLGLLGRSPIVRTMMASASTEVSGSSMKITGSDMHYVNSDIAKLIDDTLMATPGYSIDQLMELAGRSVATSVHDYLTTSNFYDARDTANKVLVFCGPGNNGGDGLVAARHLKTFGYDPTVVYPRRGKSGLFTNLVHQLEDLDVAVLDHNVEPSTYTQYACIIDAMFGFSFVGPSREPFTSIISSLAVSPAPVVSVDIPSGWDVDDGDVYKTGFSPSGTVSLTLPKMCMRGYTGVHYLGGRGFLTPKLAKQLGIPIPEYPFGSAEIIKISSSKSLKTSNDNTDSAVIVDTNSGQAERADKSFENEEVLSVMYVTAQDQQEARKISTALVEEKLAACVGILPSITSAYVWEGKTVESQEVLMMIKAPKSLTAAVTQRVKALHSYDVPEVIALDVTGGNMDYLEWAMQQTTLSRTNEKNLISQYVKSGDEL